MNRSTCVKASGLTRLDAASPEPSTSAIWVESTPIESMRKRRSTRRPSSQLPARPNCLPSCFRVISAYQFWLVFRIGKIQSLSGRLVTSASGVPRRTISNVIESVVERVVPRTAMPWAARAARSARAAKRLGSGRAKDSVRGTAPCLDVALGPDRERPGGAEEVDGLILTAAHRPGLVLEGDVAEIGRERQCRGRADAIAGGVLDVDAVVVVAKPAHRCGIPPVEVVALPCRVHDHGLEPAPVSHHVAGHRGDAGVRELGGELGELLHRVGVAGAGRRWYRWRSSAH